MADDWESARGLGSDNPDDRSMVMPSGYTAIEEYINGLADGFFGVFSDRFEGAPEHPMTSSNSP